MVNVHTGVRNHINSVPKLNKPLIRLITNMCFSTSLVANMVTNDPQHDFVK